MTLTITNIRRPNADTSESLTIENGLIKGWNLEEEGDTLDGNGATIVPAFIEPHAHLREPGQEQKEDLASGLAAAAAGGYGTVVSMPNTSPVVDDPAIVRALIEKAATLGLARLRPAAALTRGQDGEQLAELGLLGRCGRGGVHRRRTHQRERPHAAPGPGVRALAGQGGQRSRRGRGLAGGRRDERGAGQRGAGPAR